MNKSETSTDTKDIKNPNVEETVEFDYSTLTRFSIENLLKITFDEENGDFYIDPFEFSVLDKHKNCEWLRPTEYSNHLFPKISNEIISSSAAQLTIEDCPLISSIIATAYYDNYHGTNFINSMIYPQVRIEITQG